MTSPARSDGKPWPTANWASYLSALKSSPTDKNIAEFRARFPNIDLKPLLGDKWTGTTAEPAPPPPMAPPPDPSEMSLHD